MKNLLLTSLFIVALGFTSFATNNSTETSDYTSEETLDYNDINSNYYNVISNLKVNTFVKLIQLNDFDAVSNLINAGEKINRKSIGMTPLMYAARQNKIAIVKLLLAEGAKTSIESKYGYTALDYAKMSKATESFDLIKAAM